MKLLIMQFPKTSSLLRPHILKSPILKHPQFTLIQKAGKITVLYILIFKF